MSLLTFRAIINFFISFMNDKLFYLYIKDYGFAEQHLHITTTNRTTQTNEAKSDFRYCSCDGKDQSADCEENMLHVD
jgi:hypothetical protein